MKGLNHSASFVVSTSSKLSTSSLGRHRHRVVMYTGPKLWYTQAHCCCYTKAQCCCNTYRPNVVVLHTGPMLLYFKQAQCCCNIHRLNVVVRYTGPMLLLYTHAQCYCSMHRPNVVVAYTGPMLYTAQTQT